MIFFFLGTSKNLNNSSSQQFRKKNMRIFFFTILLVISTMNDVIRIKNLNTIKEKIKFENATNKTFLSFLLSKHCNKMF